jgi:hypothetical protein
MTRMLLTMKEMDNAQNMGVWSYLSNLVFIFEHCFFCANIDKT